MLNSVTPYPTTRIPARCRQPIISTVLLDDVERMIEVGDTATTDDRFGNVWQCAWRNVKWHTPPCMNWGSAHMTSQNLSLIWCMWCPAWKRSKQQCVVSEMKIVTVHFLISLTEIDKGLDINLEHFIYNSISCGILNAPVHFRKVTIDFSQIISASALFQFDVMFIDEVLLTWFSHQGAPIEYPLFEFISSVMYWGFLFSLYYEPCSHCLCSA